MLKKILKIILKIIGWLGLFVLLLIIRAYNEKEPDFYMVTALYTIIIIEYYRLKSDYSYWQLLAESDEFHERFCKRYSPNILGNIFVFAIGLRFFNIIGVVVCVILPYLYDLWERRFITADIKQDIILEKLTRH